MRAFAFNFFHFKGGRWHHVCQPLMYTTKWKGMEQQWVPALSDVKAPFERDIVDYGYQGDGPRQPAVLAPVPQPIRMGPCRSCDCRAFVAGAMKGFLPVCATCGHPHPAF